MKDALGVAKTSPHGDGGGSVLLVGRFAEALNLTLQSSEPSRVGGSSAGEERPLTFFDSSVVPTVSIEAYVRRLHKHFLCSDVCFVIALVYIDRLLRPNTRIGPLSPRNTHLIVLASLLIATKFMEDVFYSNGYYAKCGGVSLKELNKLERVILKKIGFGVYVSDKEYLTYERALQRLGAGDDFAGKGHGHGHPSSSSSSSATKKAPFPSTAMMPQASPTGGNGQQGWLSPSAILGIMTRPAVGDGDKDGEVKVYSPDELARRDTSIPNTPSTCSSGPLPSSGYQTECDATSETSHQRD